MQGLNNVHLGSGQLERFEVNDEKTVRGFAGLLVLFCLSALGNCLGQDNVVHAQTTAKVGDRVNIHYQDNPYPLRAAFTHA